MPAISANQAFGIRGPFCLLRTPVLLLNPAIDPFGAAYREGIVKNISFDDVFEEAS